MSSRSAVEDSPELKQFKNSLSELLGEFPECIGYPDCDGDLPGMPHMPKCVRFGKPAPPSWRSIAVRERSARNGAEAALRAIVEDGNEESFAYGIASAHLKELLIT